VRLIDGTPVDLLDGLDQTAIGKRNGGTAVNGAAPATGPLDEQALVAGISSGTAYHTSCVRLIGKWAQEGLPLLNAQDRLYEMFDQVFPPDRDDRWQMRRADIPRIVRDIYSKEAQKRDEKEPSSDRVKPVPVSELYALAAGGFIWTPTGDLWP